MKVINYIKKSVAKLKDPYWKARCKYIHYYETLEIDEKAILLESQFAKKADGNIYYILKYLTSAPEYKDYTIYLSSWGRYRKQIASLLDSGKIKGVNIILYSSDKYVRLLASAKYLINDVTFPFYYIKKEGQVYLNTWHGTPLKALGKSMQNDISIGNVQKNFVCADYLLFANQFTKDVMIRDYMIENISSGSSVLCGYPRNSIFFDETERTALQDKVNPSRKRIYAYMPTWRGTSSKIGSTRDDTYMMFFLYELDRQLNDDEVLYLNLHPMAATAKNNIEIKQLKHIKPFPGNIETYNFLNIADVLITDYSSVFFDFANTRKKIVLFPYDKEEYLNSRGVYFSMDELPFPQVFDVPSLLNELRSDKNYDDTSFIDKFCHYDNINAAQQICDLMILGKNSGLSVEKIPNNGKENVLLYAGNMDKNGITTSLRSLTNCLDLNKRNYYLSFCQGKVKNNAAQLRTFNDDLNYFAIAEHLNMTIRDRFFRKLYSKKLMTTKLYMKLVGKRIKQELPRAYGTARFDTAIQFCGYENDLILTYSQFDGNNAVFVHNDMISEIKTRHNQRTSVLKYAYRNYDHVVTVSEDIVPPTIQLAGKNDSIITVHNTIDYKSILKRSQEPITLSSTTKCSVNKNRLMEILSSDNKKFINIARFSPEKGHDRLVNAFYKLWKENPDIYLIIMGGNSRGKGYEELLKKVKEMGLENNVILLLAVFNPYPIIKACNYFIMSSFYEGLPMVLFEADMLGLPIASTDVKGPHGFLTRFGGTLVDNSEDGVFKGLSMLLNGEIRTLNIDYDAYNNECVQEFEQIFTTK